MAKRDVVEALVGKNGATPQEIALEVGLTASVVARQLRTAILHELVRRQRPSGVISGPYYYWLTQKGANRIDYWRRKDAEAGR